MSSKVILLSVVLVAVCIWQCQAYKPCIVPKQGHMDETWFIDAAAKGWFVAEHSNCDNCEKEEAWSWLKAAGRTIPKKMCWSMHVTTRYGDYILPFNCKYNDITKEECELDTSKTDIKDQLKYGGQFIITHSDNHTYVAGTTCIFNKENFWWILTSDSNLTLPPGVQDQIKADFTKMGFQSGNIAVKGSSALFVSKMSSIPANC